MPTNKIPDWPGGDEIARWLYDNGDESAKSVVHWYWNYVEGAKSYAESMRTEDNPEERKYLSFEYRRSFNNATALIPVLRHLWRSAHKE